MNRRKETHRILHVVTTFTPSSGAAQNILLTLNRLPREDFEVFLALRPGQETSGLSSDVSCLPVDHLIRPLRPWHDVLAFIALLKLCRRWQFAVVHTHNSKDGILGRWAAHLAGVPLIVHTIHNLPFRASRYRVVNSLYTLLERLTAQVTDLFLAVSGENVIAFRERGIGKREQFRVVYSGLDFQ